MPLELAIRLGDLTPTQRGDLTVLVRNYGAAGDGLTEGGGPAHRRVTTSTARRLVDEELAIERREFPVRPRPRFYPTARGVALVVADVHDLNQADTDDLIRRCSHYGLAELRDLVVLTFDDRP